MCFVEQTGLRRRGLRREVCIDKVAVGREFLFGGCDKSNKRLSVGGVDIFEVDVKPYITLLLHRGKHIIQHRRLQVRIIEQAACARAVEIAAFGDGGKQHDRRRTERALPR